MVRPLFCAIEARKRRRVGRQLDRFSALSLHHRARGRKKRRTVRTHARGACGAKMLPCVPATAAAAAAGGGAKKLRVDPSRRRSVMVCVSLVCAKETALVVKNPPSVPPSPADLFPYLRRAFPRRLCTTPSVVGHRARRSEGSAMRASHLRTRRRSTSMHRTWTCRRAARRRGEESE